MRCLEFQGQALAIDDVESIACRTVVVEANSEGLQFVDSFPAGSSPYPPAGSQRL